MTNTNSTRSRRSPRQLHRIARCAGLAMCAALAFTLVGCEPEEDVAATAIKNATDTLAKLAPGAINANLTSEQQISQFQSVAQSMQSVMSTGSPAQKASANLLIARAHLAAGEPHMHAAAAFERQILDMATEARGYVGRWEQQSSRAQSLASYDPNPELAAIDTQVREVDTRRAERNEQLSELKIQLGQLTQKIDAATQRAQQERQTEASLAEQANRTSGQSALSYYTQAVDHRRQADALEQQAGGLSAKADAIEPQVGQIEVQIESLVELRAQHMKSREAVMQRSATSREHAAEAREIAAEAQTQINTLVAQIEAIRTGQLSDTLASALESFEAGERAATAAGSYKALRSEGNMIKGQIQQSIGSMYLARDAALKPIGSLMAALHEARPELDGITELSRSASIIKQASDTHKSHALEAFTAAHEAFGSVNGNQQFQDRIDSLRGSIAGLTTSYSGGELDLSAGEIDDSFDQELDADPIEDDTGAMTAAFADQTTPQGAVDMLFDAARAKDFISVGRFIYTENPGDQDILDTMLEAATAGFGLSDAMESQFGVNLVDAIKQASQSEAGQQNPFLGMASMGLAQMENAGAMGGAGDPSESFDDMLSMTSVDMEFQITDDTCAVFDPDDPTNEPMLMRQIDSRWYLDLDAMTATNPAMAQQTRAQIQMALPFVGQAVEGLAATKSRLDSGEFTSSDDAVLDLLNELDPMIQGIMSMMGGMNGGGGMSGMGGMGGGGE